MILTHDHDRRDGLVWRIDGLPCRGIIDFPGNLGAPVATIVRVAAASGTFHDDFNLVDDDDDNPARFSDNLGRL